MILPPKHSESLPRVFVRFDFTKLGAVDFISHFLLPCPLAQKQKQSATMADASTSSSATPAEESHPYTLETLKQHTTRDDLWLLINGKVYDVTKFMDEVSSPQARAQLGRATELRPSNMGGY